MDRHSILSAPFDILPHDRKGKAPPHASPYWTARAEAARKNVDTLLGEECIKEAKDILYSSGEHHNYFGPRSYPGVYEQNVRTLAMALQLAELDFRVIDMHGIGADGYVTGKRGDPKVPRGPNWQKRASKIRSELIRFWLGQGRHLPDSNGERHRLASRQQPRNLGIATGGDLVALDVDPSGFDWLDCNRGELPTTVTETTGRGGWHYLFRLPDGVRVANSASKIAPGIDIRGEGGCIVCAPSIHQNLNYYAWNEGLSPFEIQPAPLPDLLLEQVIEQAKPSTKKLRKNRGSRPRSKPISTNIRGFANHLGNIGDGLGGFDAPIYRAACSWFASNGTQTNTAEMTEVLRHTILNAACDDDRNVTRYAQDDYLDARIEAARKFIADQNNGAA